MDLVDFELFVLDWLVWSGWSIFLVSSVAQLPRVMILLPLFYLIRSLAAGLRGRHDLPDLDHAVLTTLVELRVRLRRSCY